MDNGIALIAIVVAAVVAATIVWLALRRNLPPEAAAVLAAYAAAIRAQLGAIVDEDMVRTIAGAIWDGWGDSAQYFTRDEFIRYVLKALRMEADVQVRVRATVRTVQARMMRQDPARPRVHTT